MATKLMELEMLAPALNAAVFGNEDGTELTLRLEEFEELGEPNFIVMEVRREQTA